MPERLFVDCSCGARLAFDPHAILTAYWTDAQRQVTLTSAPGPFGAYDPDEWGWDLHCAACDGWTRLLFEISEWGKMNTYFIDVHSLLERRGPGVQ